MSKKDFEDAKKNKKDEFYTQLVDIEKEMRHYKEHFRNKVILCNCDDPYESNFFKYFAMNFNHLALKKLIATCYIDSPVASEQLSLFDVVELSGEIKENKHPHKIEITEVNDENNDGAIDISDVEYLLKNRKNALTLLKGNGDFRSEECIELLKEADVVVTNPPFSLFSEYVSQLIEYDKKFIIIGNQNQITYKNIFKIIQENKMWLGLTMNGSNRWFRVPDYYEFDSKAKHKIDENGNHLIFVNHVVWFTNLDYPKRHENIDPYKKYDPSIYSHYVNYDAIHIPTYKDIPKDWSGHMGVPISFLHKYNPEEFEIIGQSGTLAGEPPKDLPKNLRGGPRFYLKNPDGSYQRLYDRIVIKAKGKAYEH